MSLSYKDYSGLHGSKMKLVQAAETESLIAKDTESYGFFHPKRRFYAYAMLFCTCWVSVSGYFIYDAVGSIQGQIETHYNITDSEFGLLYSVYSFPNCVLPFFGGFLLDKFGVRFGTIVCCSLVFLGSVICAVSPYIGGFYMLLAGRLIFGLGAETSYVAQNSIIVAWFADKEMALAMGLSVSAGRLGTWLTFNANPYIAGKLDWQWGLYLAALFGAVEFLSGIVYFVLDAAAEKITKKSKTDILEGEQPIDMKAVWNFSAIFWLLTVCATAYYSVVFPFESTAGVLLQNKYHYSLQSAGFVISLLPLTSMLLSPIFGIVIDKIGKRVMLVFFGIVAMTGALLFMIYTPITPIPSIIVIGIAYSLVPSAMWPCLPFVIEDQYISTAFGTLSSIMNIGLLVSYYLQGWVDQLTPDPGKQLLFYTGISAFGGIVAAWWWILDHRRGGKCDKVMLPQVEEFNSAAAGITPGGEEKPINS